MAEKKKFMSRRAILAAAGMTPAMLLGMAISPEVKAQIAASLAGMQFSNDQGNKLADVIENLWSSFVIGVGSDVEVAPGVLNAALAKSLQPILNNLADFPEDGKHLPTLICAYICGTKAAANATPGGQITPPIFNAAWDETKNEADVLLGAAGVPGLAC